MLRRGIKEIEEWNAQYTGKGHHGEDFGRVRYPGSNGVNGMNRMGGGSGGRGGGLGTGTGDWIGTWENFVEHERSTQTHPNVIQNALKVGLAEGVIREIQPGVYDFSGLQEIPGFGADERGWTAELNHQYMRYEYEDTEDLGLEGTYAKEKAKVREEAKGGKKSSKKKGWFK